ncbi:MAG: hypothetical protein R6V35_03925 [Candidatus Nanohaloarchaea archaeon]
MNKMVSLAMVMFIVMGAFTPQVFSQSSDDTSVSVSIDRTCSVNSRDFRFNGAYFSNDLQSEIVGLNTTGNFEYLPNSRGEMSFSEFNISAYRTEEIETAGIGNETDNNTTDENTTDDEINSSSLNIETTELDEENKTYINLSKQPNNYTQYYLLNSSNANTDPSLSRLFPEADNAKHYVRSFRHNTTEEITEKHQNSSLIGYNSTWEPLISVPRLLTFDALYEPGKYTAELSMKYRCEFSPGVDSDFYVESEDRVFTMSEYETYIENNSVNEAQDLSIDGLNVSEYDGEASEPYAVTNEEENIVTDEFAILDLEGEGVIPDDVGEDNEVNQEVETDAEIPDNATTEFETDADETLDEADPRQGADSNFPGETEVPEPEPEPEPDPVPLLSLSIRPLNSTYEAPRSRFTEVGLEIENIGEESVNNVELEPRYSEGMNWESQIGNIDSLEVGDSVNRSVYVNPGEDVSPGTYQIPVYASNAESDIDMQYVNVEVLQQVFQGTLNIQEAPRDVRFERNSNNTIPILVENQGEDSIQNVQVEVENSEACGEYTVDSVDSISPGESASISVQFTTGADITECSGTIVASSENGDLAFSEFNMDVKEEVGPIPEEFRVPIVASLWTVMLLAYAVLTKKYGVHNMTVKVPLVLLVVGEAFIVIYLSSVYYNVMPPGLLPF